MILKLIISIVKYFTDINNRNLLLEDIMQKWTKESVAKKIDHTILKATATENEIRTLCREAKEYSFASVCVNPRWVTLAAKELEGTPVAICTVVGFPLGANTTSLKAEEAEHAILQGATEVDMVIDIGSLKSNDIKRVEDDIRSVVEAAKVASTKVGIISLVKVIIETCYLTDDEKIAACLAAKNAGAQFVKTSTGFGSGGATIEDVELMKKTVGTVLKVKASGGIRDTKTALAMLEAGADRLGVSAGVAIVNDL